MKLFHLTAIDEFGRVYNYTQVLSHDQFVISNWDLVYQYYFNGMVREILEKMGTDASAEWSCVEENHVFTSERRTDASA